MIDIGKIPVFTLQSIKSRIETWSALQKDFQLAMFLLYSPLNQGLKQNARLDIYESLTVFTLQSIKSRIETRGTNHLNATN